MKYTECRWHKFDESPIKDLMYIVVTICGEFGLVRWSPRVGWYRNDIKFWSDYPAEPTQEELDEEEYEKWINTPAPSFSWKGTFLAGCKSARERIK